MEKVQFDSIYQSNMVIQAKQPFRFGGFGEPNLNFSLKITTNNKNIFEQTIFINNDGSWSSQEVYYEYDDNIKVEVVLHKTKPSILILNNIVAGDVYLFSGQSNIEYKLKDDIDYNEASYVNDTVCIYEIPQKEYKGHHPSSSNGKWTNFSSIGWKDKSAIAYYASKYIVKNKVTHHKIGIVCCYKGGTSASSWVPIDSLKENENLKKIYLEPFYENTSKFTSKEQEKMMADFETKSRDYQLVKKEMIDKFPNRSLEDIKKEIGHTPWPPPLTEKSYQRPGGLYETMFLEAAKLQYSGIVWYQGEEDVQYGTIYKDLLMLLIKEWRKKLNRENIPVFVIQLPKYGDAPKDSWPITRKCQQEVGNDLNNVYVICTIDQGEEFNIHPTSKKCIGNRVGLFINKVIYERKTNFIPKLENFYKISSDSIFLVFSGIKELSIKSKNKVNIECYSLDNNLVGLKVNQNSFNYAWGNFDDSLYLFNELDIPIYPFNIHLYL